MPSLRSLRTALFGIAVSFLTACGHDTTAPQFTTAGHWSALAYGATITLSLQEESGNIAGTGMYDLGGVRTLTVTGQRVGTGVTLTFASSGYQPITFSGTLQSSASMAGTLNGSGYSHTAATFTKQ